MSESTSTESTSGEPSETLEPAPVRRRKPTLDQKLADARDFALAALKELVPEAEIGDGHRVQADDDRLVTHYFPSLRSGYKDWEWYVTIARAPRQTEPTVCETGLLPADGALLAPEWVPWAERLHDDEKDDAEGDPENGPENDEAVDTASESDSDPDADPDAEPGADADSAEGGESDPESELEAEIEGEADEADGPTD